MSLASDLFPSIRPLLLGAVVISLVGACGGGTVSAPTSYSDNARQAYEEALEDFDSDNCIDAEPAFRRIRREYPYSRYAALAELRAADCLVKDGKLAEAIQAYRQFVRNRPSHGEVPYARFKIAETYFKQVPDDFFLSPPAHERDQGATHDALEQLQSFLEDYSEGENAEKAREMQRSILSQLARHELYVANFYLERDHPSAAIGRLRTLLTAYPGSGIEPEAYLLLGETHLHMHQAAEARQAFQELTERFPDSGYAAQARAYLADLGTD